MTFLKAGFDKIERKQRNLIMLKIVNVYYPELTKLLVKYTGHVPHVRVVGWTALQQAIIVRYMEEHPGCLKNAIDTFNTNKYS